VLLSGRLFAQDQALLAKSKQAHQDMEAGRFGDAAELYRELVKAIPDEPRLRLNLAIALDKAGQPAEAIPELQAVVSAEPKLEAAWFLLGVANAQLKRPRDAIGPLRQAVQLNQSNWRALFELADAELSSGEPTAAAQDFGRLAKNQPDLAKAWEGLGLAYLTLSDRAIMSIKEVDVHSPYWYALLAQTRVSEGDPDSAAGLYLRAIERDPQIPGLHAALAAVYTELDRASDAAKEEQLEAALPKANCAAASARCLFQRGDWQGALNESSTRPTIANRYWASLASRKLAEQSLSHLSKLAASGEVHELLADSAQRAGRRLDAIAEWRKAIEAEPGNARLEGRLAESLYRAREYPEAQRRLEALVKAQPENPDWQYLLGVTLARQSREEEALPFLEKAVRLEPDFLPAQENLGRVYLKLGQPAKAVTCLERALPIDDGSISFSLSSAYRRLGRREEERRAFARYQQMQRDLTRSQVR
jgi:predicted Zn-dependent protease